MTDFVELFRHWNAGRSQVQIYQALNIDRKTIRKYVAPALAEGLQPCPAEVFDEELWRARIGRWFPELVDPVARALTWPQIAVHHQWIADQLAVPVTVATIAQRLRDDHKVEVSESTVRRYIATTFTEARLEDRVTVPRGAGEAGSEAQIDYGDTSCGTAGFVVPWLTMRDMTQSREPTLAREISRQTFLRGAAGALAAGAVFGSVRATADPNNSGWDGLSAAIGGQVLLPDGGPQFATAKQVFNTNYNGSTPAAIVTVISPAEVQKAMAFAAAHNLKVAPRSGGHSYVGGSTANGTMVLDLRQLPGGIDFDAASGQVTVTPATSLYDLHQALAAAGRGIPTGTCPSVGAAGHALGGGLGAQSRHAGLMSDALTSASVVLPGGQAVTASAANNPDLFWALRGSGGGNFGVTTSLTFATFPTAEYDVVNLNFPPQSFAQVLVGWQNWLRTADRNSWALADSTTDAMGTHCRIMATSPAGSGNSVASAIISAVGLQPTGTDNHTFNYLDLVGYLAVGNLNPSPLGYVGGSDVFPTITPAAAQGIASAVDAYPRGAGRMLAIMHALDGALASVAPGATAFPWRRQSALVQWYVETSGSPSAATSWLNTAHQAVQPYSVGGYVNYIEANQSPSRYFGPNLAQLSAVRQKYDPGRVMFSGLNF